MKILFALSTILILVSCTKSNKSGKDKSITLPVCGETLTLDCAPPQEEQVPNAGSKSVARVSSAINILDLNNRRGRKTIDILENVSDEAMIYDLEDCSLSLQSGTSIKAIRLRNTLRVVDESGVKIYEAMGPNSSQGILGKWREVVELEDKTIRTILDINRKKLSVRRVCLYK